MYRTQPLFYEVDEFLHSQGFQLFDIKKFYWRRKCGLGFDGTMRGQIAHGDALYFRKPDVYINILQNSDCNIKERLLKSVAIALFFGYSSYAICLLDKGKSENVINAEDQFIITDLILEDSKKRSNDSNEMESLPDFIGKSLLIRIIKKLNRLFDIHEEKYLQEYKRILALNKSYHGWAQIDKEDVGNNISHR